MILLTPAIKADPIDWSQKYRSCVVDCRDALSKADKVIADQKQELDLYSQKDAQSQKDIASLNVQLQNRDEELDSIWRNPFVIGILGILVGGAAGVYLVHH